MTADSPSRREIPDATVARLPGYLRALSDLAARGVTGVSSEELAQMSGVRSANLRKDLSYLGSYGVRGVGYDVETLAGEIARELGLTQEWHVVIVGMGNLGHALAAYSGFATKGFRIVGLVDDDPEVVGTRIAGQRVRPVGDLATIASSPGIAIGVIATPPAAAQQVCDLLVGIGVRSVLNFAPCVLDVAPEVVVRRVDMSTELQILAFHEQRKALDLAGPPPSGLAVAP